ncbi:MAG: L-threonine 3-dehydrogenase [Eubacteriales bacterium]|nr:L-threonine 3-dehydrogenase [Clostridiales bacterium]MDY5836599.1 L-threonine 3-dehydrogenase [Eubacteriales bacterium]
MSKKILLTGCLGQIGTELTMHMRRTYGNDQVIASDIVKKDVPEVMESGPFEILDVTDAKRIAEVVDKYKVDTVLHLAAILSAVGEQKPTLAYNINMGGLFNVLEVAREKDLQVFTPSSIGSFGASTPKDHTPQDTLQRPSTMYGVTKVAGELLCDYYHTRFGVDTRGVRFPGLISYAALPGGGTTDYAVHIFYEAIKKHSYASFIAPGTYMDMMYMPDALKAVTMLMEADPSKLVHRNAFNVTAMSFEPEQLGAEIKKHIPDFKLTYEVDPVRQAIAESWPNSLDDSCARQEWGWAPEYDMAAMVKDMLEKLQEKGI